MQQVSSLSQTHEDRRVSRRLLKKTSVTGETYPGSWFELPTSSPAPVVRSQALPTVLSAGGGALGEQQRLHAHWIKSGKQRSQVAEVSFDRKRPAMRISGVLDQEASSPQRSMCPGRRVLVGNEILAHSFHRSKTRRQLPGGPRVAIATCTRGCCASRLREWLFWHLAQGIAVIFLRWQGPMDREQRAILHSPIKRGEVVLSRNPPGSGRLSSGFQAVMCRQVTFVHEVLQAARQRGCDFLLHIDDDEILFPRASGETLLDIFHRHWRTSTGGSADAGQPCMSRCIHFDNLEAVFPFTRAGQRPLSMPGTKFRSDGHSLYCNGKSAANLQFPTGEVFCSGVHHFCRYDRSYEEDSPEYGLHDEGGGCIHEDCCVLDTSAVVLHFDSSSFAEWRAKFGARAAARLTRDDEEEMRIFPFKKESVDAIRRRRNLERVYRRWRCLPCRSNDVLDPELSGQNVEQRFVELLAEVGSRAS